MTEPLRVKKSQLIAGTRVTEDIEVDLEVDGGIRPVTLTIRPLDSGEWALIQDIQFRGQSMDMALGDEEARKSGDASKAPSSVRMDMGSFLAAETEADFAAAAFGLSIKGGDRWSVADVKRLRPPGVEKTIARGVYALTGVKPEGKADAELVREEAEAQAESFRDEVRADAGGAAADASPSPEQPPRPDAG